MDSKVVSMSETILVEPADGRRREFALWCLAQDPPIPSASATGSAVPVELFASVPDELLDGARIDGHPFRPVRDGYEPHGDGYEPHRVPEPVEGPEKPAQTRRKPSRKGTSK